MLSKGHVTFGSFNNLAKITPVVLATWARLLAVVPESRLLLKRNNFDSAAERHRVRAAYAAAGGDATRLDLHGWSEHAKMLAEYGEVDIALDPFPFCGGLTSCEALWMGVPVVTLPGDSPVSRQTLGFLTLLRLADRLAVNTPASYIAAAAALAANSAALSALRAALRPRMAASALCDAPRFAGELEAVYRRLWDERATVMPSQPA